MSVARRLSDNSDAEIRNAVEGFASETALAEAGERSFDRWYEETLAGTAADDDAHFRASQSAAYIGGYLAMARDLGHLPEVTL